MSTEYDDEGYLRDEYGHQIGVCNSCGEEVEAGAECCDDGEVVPAVDHDHIYPETHTNT